MNTDEELRKYAKAVQNEHDKGAFGGDKATERVIDNLLAYIDRLEDNIAIGTVSNVSMWEDPRDE